MRVGTFLDRLERSLPAAAAVLVAAFATRRLDDFDTWWHLAAGRWIVHNAAVPRTDVLSFTVPHSEWINLQWLFDVVLYGVHAAGGPDALVLLSVACFVGTFALLARHAARHVGPLASALLLAWVAMTVNERFLIRPEMATFPLLAAVQLVLAEGRERPACLAWLVPLMLLWANMHSLFILGIGAIVCAVAGAFASQLPLLPAAWRHDAAWPSAARRSLLRWGGAAIAATLVNPYFLRAWFFPLELMSRIDGSSQVYQSIGEFRRPFSGYFPTFAIGSYQAFFFALLALLAVAALLRAVARTPRRGAATADRTSPGGSFDIGAVAFALALAWLSLLARRNIGVFAIGALPAFAAALAVLAARLPRAWTGPGSSAARGLAVATLLAMGGVCASVATNRWYAATGETHEFGLGVFESNFHPRATAFFREQKLPGPSFNDMTAGGYLAWDDPTGEGVYIDGRLEVYDTPFFDAYLSSLSDIGAWKRDADARGIRSATVFHRWGNRHSFLRLLMARPDWRLVYFDETVAILVRTGPDTEGLIAAARTAFASHWRHKTDAALSGPTLSRPWQRAIERYTAQIAYARLLETIGEGREALRWYEAALALGLPRDYEIDARRRAAVQHAGIGQYAQARVHLVRALEVDPVDEMTLDMLARLDAIAR